MQEIWNKKLVNYLSTKAKVGLRNGLSYVYNPQKPEKRSRRLWLDLGGVASLCLSSTPEMQDHGVGLLRTILHQRGIETELLSTRMLLSWRQLNELLKGYDLLLMNVRSYNFDIARKAAEVFKKMNPTSLVIVGGVHASVALDEMLGVKEFDHICQGPGESIIADIISDPYAFPRVIKGVGAKSMSEWPIIDRRLWPDPKRRSYPWPLEPECGFGCGPVATVLTSRSCPWHCAFCNEASYLPVMRRRSVDQVIDELNFLDRKFGPIGSVIIHDSMFFQNPAWLREWLEKYPRKTNKCWSYWAAARADTIRQWPDLFEALVRKTNWNVVSVGFESGSERMLKVLNKECTPEDNYFAINLLNRLGDDLERKGGAPLRVFSNIMLGIPGETRDDAYKTMQMLRDCRRVIPSFSFYTPYPGSVLGYQLIAEGKSLMAQENYCRNANGSKVSGLDYSFYQSLLAGKYDDKIQKG
jgi:anaerobic magnesium-protoporphyrin IX monomethyl ester cyclase